MRPMANTDTRQSTRMGIGGKSSERKMPAARAKATRNMGAWWKRLAEVGVWEAALGIFLQKY
jgi:hypothetical protein